MSLSCFGGMRLEGSLTNTSTNIFIRVFTLRKGRRKLSFKPQQGQKGRLTSATKGSYTKIWFYLFSLIIFWCTPEKTNQTGVDLFILLTSVCLFLQINSSLQCLMPLDRHHVTLTTLPWQPGDLNDQQVTSILTSRQNWWSCFLMKHLRHQSTI